MSNSNLNDFNDPDFFDKLQEKVEVDLAVMKNYIESVRFLRVAAAEIEVESAALYHATLFKEFIDVIKLIESYKQDELHQ